ncbi:polyketide synthase, partial [Chromobacterium piscinae]
VNYIETHGTGTELGDAVEIEGLKSAFRKLGYEKASGQSTKNCAIGSVKSNIGHTELASGMASLIKVVYQMKNEMLVKTIHCDSINPYLNLDESPFFVVRENQRWNMIKDKFGASLPRRAGISSFGLSGVNAHII